MQALSATCGELNIGGYTREGLRKGECCAPPRPCLTRQAVNGPLPAEKLNAAKGWDLWIHVDAASGGFVAPFLMPDLVCALGRGQSRCAQVALSGCPSL